MWTPFLAQNDSNQKTPHAHVQSERDHTSAVKSTSLHGAKSQSSTPSRMPQDSSPYQPVSTNTHVPLCASRHVAPIPSHHNPYQMKFNELQQKSLPVPLKRARHNHNCTFTIFARRWTAAKECSQPRQLLERWNSLQTSPWAHLQFFNLHSQRKNLPRTSGNNDLLLHARPSERNQN